MAHGGKRPGAGRPKGAKDKLTREAGASLAEIAREHTESAISTLVQIAVSGESEAARVSAANALLDRGYGKAPQSIEHTGEVSFRKAEELSDDDLAKLATGQ